MTSFGILKKLKIKDIWENEPNKFTPWLADNIQTLGKTLGMDLELTQREANVGDFSLDLLAQDLGSNRTVVIENQLTQTDHDHLGKLLTYASGFNASVVIWLAESIREEHRQALEWLNQKTDTDTEFFGVVIEVLQIDNSKPAYNFKPVVFPNEWQKNKRKSDGGKVSGKMEAYRSFYQALIDELREKHKFTNARKGQPQSWYSFSSGIASGIIYSVSFAMGERVRVELYIDQGDTEKNKKLFDALYTERESIANDLGSKLEWERLDNKRSSRIAIYRSGSIELSDAELAEIKEWSIDNLLKFKKVFPSYVKKHLRGINK